MPIRWDTLLTRHTAQELDRALVGSRLRAVRMDRRERDLMLLFREHTLIWRLHPTRGYVTLRGAVEPTETDHRFRHALAGVASPADERLVRFRFSPGRDGSLSVIVELMSNQWNAVVTEGDHDIVRHVVWRPKSDARRLVGQSYQPPPPTGRVGVRGDVTLEDWQAALDTTEGAERSRTLVRRYAWTSPLNASAFLGPASESGGLDAGHALWKDLIQEDALAEPTVLELENGPQPYPFPLPHVPSHRVPSLLEAFEECVRWAEGDAAASAVLGAELLKRLDRRIEQAARRVTSIEVELENLPDPDRLRAVGDLILARYHEVPAGSTAATLQGFDGEPVRVELDPAEPAHANAARYYEKAAKAERAGERLPGLLLRATDELVRLEALLESVRAGSASETEVVQEVGPAHPSERGTEQGPTLPYRSFWSSGGLEIRVGRGSRHNDALTFKHSAPNDIWLHARHSAGAHVVLRWPGPGGPPARDLREAATLAALHSKARTSGSVPVDWTARKYVRKPRKSPPGRVVTERTETVFVEPDEALLERLRDRPQPL